MCADDVNHFSQTDCLRGVLDTEYNDSESCTAEWRLVVALNTRLPAETEKTWDARHLYCIALMTVVCVGAG